MFRAVLDRLARMCGYFTSQDLQACVASAEAEALKALRSLPSVTALHAPIETPPHRKALQPGLIEYFVSYSFASSNGRSGFGCSEIGREQTVRSFEDVQGMTRSIERSFAERDGGTTSVVVLNWQRYDAPLPPDGGREDVPVEDEKSGGVVLRLVA